MPEAKAFWMLQIMDEIRPFPRYNSNWHLMSLLKLLYSGNGQTDVTGQKDSYLSGEKKLQGALLQERTFPQLLEQILRAPVRVSPQEAAIQGP